MNPELQARIDQQQREVIADFTRRMAAAQPPKSAIEIAEAWGVDLQQLAWAREHTPLQRLRLMQAMTRFVIEARASNKLHKGGAQYDSETGLREPASISR